MGGGGSSGKIDFPTHMKDIHQDWMGYSGGVTQVTTDMIGVMNNALGSGGNPYENVSLTDPDSDMTEVENRYSSYETEVNSLDEETDWANVIDQAVSKADEADILNEIDITAMVSAAKTNAVDGISQAVTAAVDAIDDYVIREAVKNYQRRTDVSKERAISRFSSTMADVNAVNSSAYMFGLAILEAQHLQDADQFQSKLELQTYDRAIQAYIEYFKSGLQARLQAEVTNKQSRERLIAEGAKIMVNMLNSRIQSYANSTQLLNEVKKTRIAATQDYELGDADLNYKFSKWDFEVFERGANVFGSIHGSSAALPDQPSKAKSAISGALGGVAAGAQAGTVLGMPGALVGGVLGGIGGLLS